jgi:hypothetical protein
MDALDGSHALKQALDESQKNNKKPCKRKSSRQQHNPTLDRLNATLTAEEPRPCFARCTDHPSMKLVIAFL